MHRNELLPRLLGIAKKVTGEDALMFDEDTPFEAIEEWDSLNHVHMVVGMEKDFGIRFADPARLQGVVKVRDLLDIIADLKGI
jgi:acyl carrier protein